MLKKDLIKKVNRLCENSRPDEPIILKNTSYSLDEAASLLFKAYQKGYAAGARDIIGGMEDGK